MRGKEQKRYKKRIIIRKWTGKRENESECKRIRKEDGEKNETKNKLGNGKKIKGQKSSKRITKTKNGRRENEM